MTLFKVTVRTDTERAAWFTYHIEHSDPVEAESIAFDRALTQANELPIEKWSYCEPEFAEHIRCEIEHTEVIDD